MYLAWKSCQRGTFMLNQRYSCLSRKQRLVLVPKHKGQREYYITNLGSYLITCNFNDLRFINYIFFTCTPLKAVHIFCSRRTAVECGNWDY
uniref:Uncharacterized protein n=1 Tax=Salix viminalis TaxID=40686 RepID=A0A6N2K710_SALVM